MIFSNDKSIQMVYAFGSHSVFSIIQVINDRLIFFSLKWQNCKLITNCKVHFYCVFYYKSCISYTFPTFFWPFPVKNFFFLDSKVYFYCLKVCSIWKYVFALLALVLYFSFFICWLCYDIPAFLFGFCYFLWFTLVFHFIFGILQLFDNFCCFHLSLLH